MTVSTWSWKSLWWLEGIFKMRCDDLKLKKMTASKPSYINNYVIWSKLWLWSTILHVDSCFMGHKPCWLHVALNGVWSVVNIYSQARTYIHSIIQWTDDMSSYLVGYRCNAIRNFFFFFFFGGGGVLVIFLAIRITLNMNLLWDRKIELRVRHWNWPQRKKHCRIEKEVLKC